MRAAKPFSTFFLTITKLRLLKKERQRQRKRQKKKKIFNNIFFSTLSREDDIKFNEQNSVKAENVKSGIYQEYIK